MAKQKSLQEIQNQIDSLTSENLSILNYNGYRNPCQIHCNTCGKDYTFSQYGNVVTRLKKKRGICEDCYKKPKKQQAFSQSLKDTFPDEDFEIIEYNGNVSSCVYKCKKCGTIHSITKATSLRNKQHLCNTCFPPRHDEVEKQKQNFTEFIEKSDKWELIDDLSNINGSTPVACRCKQCNTITSKTMYLYMKGIGCIVCNGNKKKTTEEFRQELDEDYELLSEYTNNKAPVLLKHACGFCYKVTPDAYINQGQRCPKCQRKQSRGEKAIEKFLKNNNIDFFSEFPVRIDGHNLRFDFYLPEYDMYIEFQGLQHYESKHFNMSLKNFQNQQQNDERKRQYCGNKLIEIPYTELKNIEDILSKHFC